MSIPKNLDDRNLSVFRKCWLMWWIADQCWLWFLWFR